ncbi:MAG: murein biosynthesis integral membrane protein MurJ [Marinicella pacifica]
MNLAQSTAVVSFFTLLSRLSGFVRDVLVARYFGATVWTDAFFVAFRIPNFMRRLFAEGSFSLAFIPVLNEIKTRQSEAYLKAYINHVLGALLAALLVVLALMELLAPGVIAVFAPGLLDEPAAVFNTTVTMLRITLPYLLLISLVAFSAGILNSFNRFAVPAATPILLNVCLVVAAIYFRDAFEVPVVALAWGVLAAGVVQLLVQIPALIRLGVVPVPVFKIHDPEVKKVMKLMVPTLFASSVAQINLLVDTLIASMLPLTASITFLYYSDRLMEFPLGLFGIAISTVILPKLSQAFAAKDKEDYHKTMQWGMSLAMLVAIPSAVGLFILAKPVIVTLFTYNKFSPQDALYTAYSLMVYMLGLPAYIAIKILLPAFYARKDPKSAVRIAVKAMLVNVILNVVFVALLYALDVVSLHMGLAMAGVGSAWLQCYWLYQRLKHDGVIQQALLPLHLLVKLLVAVLMMALVLWIMLQHTGDWMQWLWYQRLMRLALLIGVGVLVYFVVLWLLKAHKKLL